MSKRLPDYIFGRDHEDEVSWLAGVLVTSWPADHAMTDYDKALVKRLLIW